MLSASEMNETLSLHRVDEVLEMRGNIFELVKKELEGVPVGGDAEVADALEDALILHDSRILLNYYKL